LYPQPVAEGSDCIGNCRCRSLLITGRGEVVDAVLSGREFYGNRRQ
jgi:hypothetical protein